MNRARRAIETRIAPMTGRVGKRSVRGGGDSTSPPASCWGGSRTSVTVADTLWAGDSVVPSVQARGLTSQQALGNNGHAQMAGVRGARRWTRRLVGGVRSGWIHIVGRRRYHHRRHRHLLPNLSCAAHQLGPRRGSGHRFARQHGRRNTHLRLGSRTHRCRRRGPVERGRCADLRHAVGALPRPRSRRTTPRRRRPRSATCVPRRRPVASAPTGCCGRRSPSRSIRRRRRCCCSTSGATPAVLVGYSYALQSPTRAGRLRRAQRSLAPAPGTVRRRWMGRPRAGAGTRRVRAAPTSPAATSGCCTPGSCRVGTTARVEFAPFNPKLCPADRRHARRQPLPDRRWLAQQRRG